MVSLDATGPASYAHIIRENDAVRFEFYTKAADGIGKEQTTFVVQSICPFVHWFKSVPPKSRLFSISVLNPSVISLGDDKETVTLEFELKELSKNELYLTLTAGKSFPPPSSLIAYIIERLGFFPTTPPSIIAHPRRHWKNFVQDLQEVPKYFKMVKAAMDKSRGWIDQWQLSFASARYQSSIAVTDRATVPMDIEGIQNAVGEFMDALGFEYSSKSEPVYGSFFQRAWWKFKPKIIATADEAFLKGKAALETNYLDLPSAEATEKLAAAAERLLNATAQFDNAAFRIGRLVVIKVTDENGSRPYIFSISAMLSLQLDDNPEIVDRPKALLDFIRRNQLPGASSERPAVA